MVIGLIFPASLSAICSGNANKALPLHPSDVTVILHQFVGVNLLDRHYLK